MTNKLKHIEREQRSQNPGLEFVERESIYKTLRNNRDIFKTTDEKTASCYIKPQSSDNAITNNTNVNEAICIKQNYRLVEIINFGAEN